MTSHSEDIINLIKVFLDSVLQMTEEDKSNLLNGKGKLVVIEEKKEDNTDMDLVSVCEKLSSFETREEAVEFFAKNTPLTLKTSLIKLASLLSVYINKRDNKDKIIEKIIESTVGAKIRSKAIEDTDMSRTSSND